MIHGLEITLTGDELRGLLAERIQTHEQKVVALDARIHERKGDLPFDVRLEDDFKTVPQLESERRHWAGRASTLSLLRDHIVPVESYTLGKADLRLAELLAGEPNDDFEIAPDAVVGLRMQSRGAAIEGLRLTLPGEEVRSVLAERIQQHRSRAEYWTREQQRTPEEQTEENPLLPEHMCENEAARYTWRAEALEFIREHVDPSAVYLLSAEDVAWGELLPPKPGSLEQEEYEERTGLAFHVERLTKRIGELNLS